MRLLRLSLRNWCQHAALDVEFGDVTAVRGPNGSGKTNLVNAVVFALTGDARNDGLKEENVSAGAADKAPCAVTLWFERGGTTYELHRSVRPARQYLKGGPEVLTKAQAVRDHLQAVLGVDEQVVLDYVFVPQWGMFSFLAKKREDRAKVFGQLFGTDRAGRLWDLLQRPDLPSPPAVPDVSDQLAAAEQELADLKDQTADTTADMERAAPACAAAELVIKDHTRQRMALIDLQKRTLEHAQLLASVSALRKTLADFRDTLAEAEADYTEANNFSREAEETVIAWRARTAWTARTAAHRDSLAEAEKLLAGLRGPGPAPPEDYVAPEAREALADEVAEAKVRLAQLRSMADSFDPLCAAAACPTCGTPTSDPALAARLAAAREAVPVLAETTARLRTALSASADYDARAAALARQLEAAEARRKAALDVLAADPEVPAPARSEAWAYTVRCKLRGKLAEVMGIHKELSNAEANAAAAEARAAECAADKARLSVEVGQVVTKDAYDEAREVTQRQQDRQVLLISLARDVTRAAGRLSDLRAAAARYAEAAAGQAAASRAADRLSAVRDLFHRDRLPLAVSQYYLSRLKDDVNRNLADLDVPYRPFRVDSVDDLRFVVRFADDGSLCRAERLSGGQKVILALAFRLAVHSMFAADLGLLCLDEPTAGLDEDNLANLGPALGRLREVSKTRGLQVVLITHEAGLDNLCDRVISLAGPPQPG